jgi:hypothetical protein
MSGLDFMFTLRIMPRRQARQVVPPLGVLRGF